MGTSACQGWMSPGTCMQQVPACPMTPNTGEEETQTAFITHLGTHANDLRLWPQELGSHRNTTPLQAFPLWFQNMTHSGPASVGLLMRQLHIKEVGVEIKIGQTHILKLVKLFYFPISGLSISGENWRVSYSGGAILDRPVMTSYVADTGHMTPTFHH